MAYCYGDSLVALPDECKKSLARSAYVSQSCIIGRRPAGSTITSGNHLSWQLRAEGTGQVSVVQCECEAAPAESGCAAAAD